MKRTIIIQVLICSLLYGGMSLASDNTADAYLYYASEVSFDIHPQEQSFEVDFFEVDSFKVDSFKVDNDCCHGEDHCCNVLTHLAGFSFLSANILYIHQSNNTSHILNRFHSLSIAPPTPPPTS